MKIEHRVWDFLVLVAASIVATNATAEVIGYAPGPAGRLDIYDSRQMCMAPALYAEWLPVAGGAVAGCWLLAGGSLRVVFLDGDVVTVPASALMKPGKT